VRGDAGRNDKPQAVITTQDVCCTGLELHDVLDLDLDGKVEKTSGVCCSGRLAGSCRSTAAW
jgi:hypothetical protein